MCQAICKTPPATPAATHMQPKQARCSGVANTTFSTCSLKLNTAAKYIIEMRNDTLNRFVSTIVTMDVRHPHFYFTLACPNSCVLHLSVFDKSRIMKKCDCVLSNCRLTSQIMGRNVRK